jgi:hypothetical protein
MWLDGMSRNTIAKKLGFSNGKISLIIRSLEDEDFALPLMRELALLCKRNNTDMSDLLFKIPFIQRCNSLGVDPGKIASFFAQLYKEFEMKGLSPDQASDTIIGLSKLAWGKNMPLHQLASEIRGKYDTLEQISSDIANAKDVLSNSIAHANFVLKLNEATLDDLEIFVAYRNIIEQHYYRERPALPNLKTDEEDSPKYLFGERVG